jgi:hypothetical protein
MATHTGPSKPLQTQHRRSCDSNPEPARRGCTHSTRVQNTVRSTVLLISPGPLLLHSSPHFFSSALVLVGPQHHRSTSTTFLQSLGDCNGEGLQGHEFAYVTRLTEKLLHSNETGLCLAVSPAIWGCGGIFVIAPF